ncbi:protein kinase [Streptomyces sp. 7R007]
MDDYAGRVLADRYRLPLPPSDEYELTETRAFDTYSGQEVLVRQVPLPEVVEAEVLDAEGLPDGFTARDGSRRSSGRGGGGTRRPTDPAVRRAVEAAQAAARIPDHPRLDQVFDVFAEGGSLWIVSELVAARPLAALLAEKPLTPYRAAEVASDVLMALRVLHAHGWVHRNITARTVLVCDDGRVMLTGLAVGAAEEALCGYDPVPPSETETEGEDRGTGTPAGGSAGAAGFSGGAVAGLSSGASGASGFPGGAAGAAGRGAGPGSGVTGALRGPAGSFGPGAAVGPAGSGAAYAGDPEAARRAAIEARAAGGLPAVGDGTATGASGTFGRGALETGGDIRAARAGAIAAYRAGARAAARVQEAQQSSRAALPSARPAPEPDSTTPPNGASLPATRPAPGDDPAAYPNGGTLPGARPASGDSPASHPGDNLTPHPNGGALPGARPTPGDDPTPYPNGASLPGARPAPGDDPAVYPGDDLAPYPNGPSLPATRPPSEDGSVGQSNGVAQPYGPGEGVEGGPGVPSGQIADPYGVGGSAWHGATPRRTGDTPRTPADAAALRDGRHTALPAAPDDSGAQGQPQAPRSTPPGVQHPGLSTAPPTGAPGPDDGAFPGAPAPRATHWNDLVAATPTPRGPATALAAERARQARMAVVGPVTERWAPEQAGPVHENWQLAAPIGPATDLWALGALLFRAVQGHAPYPEESTAELVQLVCSEPPAFAEECGPLRPVVESLLRQDPTERLEFEELRGWLRSLVRSAPEPDAGTHVIAAPPTDPNRLPIVRRRGELVRRRRAGLPATTHGRHKRAKQEREHSPRRLGRLLLLLVLLLLAGAIAYAMLFMPKAGEDGAAGGQRTGAAGDVSPAPARSDQNASSEPRPEQTSPTPRRSGPSASAGATGTQTAGPDVAAGFTLRKDPEGFEVAVAKGWSRAPRNAWNQVVYSHGDFELVVVPGRDGAVTYGSDPMAYQRDEEHELQPYRSSSWATAAGLRTITVGQRVMAEGQFTWTDDQGRDLFVRNLAILIDGRYHVVQVRGPESQRDEVTRLYEQASQTYRVTG